MSSDSYKFECGACHITVEVAAGSPSRTWKGNCRCGAAIEIEWGASREEYRPGHAIELLAAATKADMGKATA